MTGTEWINADDNFAVVDRGHISRLDGNAVIADMAVVIRPRDGESDLVAIEGSQYELEALFRRVALKVAAHRPTPATTDKEHTMGTPYADWMDNMVSDLKDEVEMAQLPPAVMDAIDWDQVAEEMLKTRGLDVFTGTDGVLYVRPDVQAA